MTTVNNDDFASRLQFNARAGLWVASLTNGRRPGGQPAHTDQSPSGQALSVQILKNPKPSPLNAASDTSREVVDLSSIIDALLEPPDVPSGLSRSMMVDHLRHRSPDKGETYFEAVRRVPPAHKPEARAGRTSVSRYWDLVPPNGRFEWIPDATTERFAEIMEVAVTRCLSLGTAG